MFKLISFTFLCISLTYIAYAKLPILWTKHGCKDFNTHIINCTPHHCTQRIVGTTSFYNTKKHLNITMDIIGYEDDPMIDAKLCKVSRVVKGRISNCLIPEGAQEEFSYDYTKLFYSPEGADITPKKRLELLDARHTYCHHSDPS